MSAGARYAVACLRDTLDDLVSQGALRPIQTFALRLALDDAEKCIDSPTADPVKDVRNRCDAVGRALDVIEATQCR